MSLPGDDYLNQEPVKPIQMDVQEFVDYICAYMGDLEKRIERIERAMRYPGSPGDVDIGDMFKHEPKYE